MWDFIFDYVTDTACFGGVASLALQLLAVNIGLWILSLLVGKAWPVDFIWSTWPIYHLGVLIAEDCAPDFSSCAAWQPIIHLGVVCIWGARLTLNFIRRGGIGHEDWRYTDMRVQFGKWYPVLSLFTVFLAQSTFMFLACLPLFVLVRSPEISPFFTVSGAIVSLCGVLLEHVSDTQMDAFIAKRKECKTNGRTVLDEGLWGWSRHPNYCGELLFWWGTFFASLRSPKSLVTSVGLIGPLLMTSLFFGISVSLMEDRQLKSKRKEYEAYKRRVTSRILLWPPRDEKRN